MRSTYSYFKAASNVLYVIFIILLFDKYGSTYEYPEKSQEKKDLFSEAYEALDRGEYADSFSILKICVNYDIRYGKKKEKQKSAHSASSPPGRCVCLTLSGIFYYLGLEPLERDVCNALYIWKVCADYGSSDAQFYLGVMYSNYFSLPNLYSYQVEEVKIDKNVILLRTYFRLRRKFLRKEEIDILYGQNERYKVEIEKPFGKFRRVPQVLFTPDNRLILKIKNVRYNINELDVYFSHLDKFPSIDFYERKKGNRINYTRNHGLSLLYLYSSSLAKHPGSILALGVRYMNGYGVESNCETACRYYLKLINEIFNFDEKSEFEIVDLIRLNIPYYDSYNINNKKIKNIEIFLESSLHENHRILTMLARRYLIGIDGVEKNYKKAYAYLVKAARYNNGESLSLLGYMYLLGLGVKKDYYIASEYFLKGKKLNDSLSLNGLGYMYFFGLGKFKKNVKIAFSYFEIAAKNNLSSGQFNLACLYLTGVGTTQSLQNAFFWFYKSLNNGNLLAAYVIGYMNYNGIITSRNCKLALSLLAKVAENNTYILNTTNRIIRYTESGRTKEALFLMALLAETGNTQSQINLSYNMNSSEFSLFLPSNEKSKKVYTSRYLAMASENNDFKSLYTLGDYAYNGYGLYVRIFPMNNTPPNPTYDVNNSAYLYSRAEESITVTTASSETTGVTSVGDTSASTAPTASAASVSTTSNERVKIISRDFIDEEGILFNDKWRFHYGFKFSFNEIDYQLAYHHYKSIISYYPNNFYVIQTISKACYNLGFMYYYGIGVSKNIEKALIYFNSSIRIYPTHKAPSVLFLLYIKFNKQLHNFKKSVQRRNELRGGNALTGCSTNKTHNKEENFARSFSKCQAFGKIMCGHSAEGGARENISP
ncbi:ubiquitin-protein ligase, putative [Plasmodium ovale curtisi]|uniref:Ubiquitin-protein ligase, putative n=1 Tax=Plasmodium ovale curtisi TaxID=864141 RepID=A0A1A8W1P2_PLAOA|nr:ubiquitin-protein ligase, putative [Plasmodium ovale curtisi]